MIRINIGAKGDKKLMLCLVSALFLIFSCKTENKEEGLKSVFSPQETALFGRWKEVSKCDTVVWEISPREVVIDGYYRQYTYKQDSISFGGNNFKIDYISSDTIKLKLREQLKTLVRERPQ